MRQGELGGAAARARREDNVQGAQVDMTDPEANKGLGHGSILDGVAGGPSVHGSSDLSQDVPSEFLEGLHEGLWSRGGGRMGAGHAGARGEVRDIRGGAWSALKCHRLTRCVRVALRPSLPVVLCRPLDRSDARHRGVVSNQSSQDCIQDLARVDPPRLDDRTYLLAQAPCLPWAAACRDMPWVDCSVEEAAQLKLKAWMAPWKDLQSKGGGSGKPGECHIVELQGWSMEGRAETERRWLEDRRVADGRGSVVCGKGGIQWKRNAFEEKRGWTAHSQR